MNAISDVATPGSPIGDMLSAVRIRPYTVKGCRPTSVVIHPQITAAKPDGPITRTARCSQRFSNSDRRQRRNRLQSPIAAIRKPMPIIARKVKNTIVEFGRSARGKSFSPGTRPSSVCVRINEPACGSSIL